MKVKCLLQGKDLVRYINGCQSRSYQYRLNYTCDRKSLYVVMKNLNYLLSLTNPLRTFIFSQNISWVLYIKSCTLCHVLFTIILLDTISLKNHLVITKFGTNTCTATTETSHFLNTCKLKNATNMPSGEEFIICNTITSPSENLLRLPFLC
jgi:hypothetical protein